ncbi:MAG: hypothetical protein JWM97_2991, partial [Phycisphaerales bacterium]|nr:hypothetical protein [Phycisphaerales bacterium]
MIADKWVLCVAVCLSTGCAVGPNY